MNSTALSPGRTASTGRGPVLLDAAVARRPFHSHHCVDATTTTDSTRQDPFPAGRLLNSSLVPLSLLQHSSRHPHSKKNKTLSETLPGPLHPGRPHNLQPDSTFQSAALARPDPTPILAAKSKLRSFLWPLHCAHPQCLTNNWNVFPSPLMLPSHVNV